MQPTISRQAVLIDRRQPGLRWSAIFAGTACSVGFWMLLQLLGLGIGLAAINVDDAGSLRGVGIGTTVWTLVTPLIAMFFGGLIAGRFAQTPDRKLAGVHGLVMWAITSVVGLGATVWMVAMLAGSVASAGGVAVQATGDAISSAPDQIDPGQALDARARDLRQRAGHAALSAADATGKALATVGLSLLLSLIASAGGAALAVRRRPKQTGGEDKPRGARYSEPGYPMPPIETSPCGDPLDPPGLPPR